MPKKYDLRFKMDAVKMLNVILDKNRLETKDGSIISNVRDLVAYLDISNWALYDWKNKITPSEYLRNEKIIIDLGEVRVPKKEIMSESFNEGVMEEITLNNSAKLNLLKLLYSLLTNDSTTNKRKAFLKTEVLNEIAKF
jgi:hypothetical protein